MIKNKLICSIKSLYYFIYEKIRLKYERYKYKEDNNPNPLITVYTPTYNRVKLLIDRAVSSVLSQTYTNFEYIIVGDGCTDDTELTIESINDDRIKFYNIKRKRPHHKFNKEKDWFLSGTYPANFALKIAKGKYICKIDDDDIWDPSHLRELLEYISITNFEFISSQYEEERFGKRKVVEGYQLSKYLRAKQKWNDNLIGGHSTWMFRSYLKFMKYNPHAWRKKWNRVDDTDLLYRMYKRGVWMGFLSEVLTYVLPHKNEETIGLDAVKNRKEVNKIEK